MEFGKVRRALVVSQREVELTNCGVRPRFYMLNGTYLKAKSDRLRSLDDVIARIDDDVRASSKRGPFKKRAAQVETEILPRHLPVA